MSNFSIKACCPSCRCKFTYTRPQSEKINLSENKEKKDEVDEMLSELKEFNSVLSKWNLEFIKSIKTCIEKNNSISLKQFDKLASIVNSINKE